MKKKLLFIGLITCLLILPGCKKSVEEIAYNILGSWGYTETGETGVYDTGTITFNGSTSGGTYTLINFYQIEYSGDFVVDGDKITLTGAKGWTGTISDERHMSGSWIHEGHALQWSAVKQ